MENNKINTPVKPYGKGELATMYVGPSVPENTARKWLAKELKSYPGLMEELRRLGYNPRQHAFTIAQVRAIFEAIGEPS